MFKLKGLSVIAVLLVAMTAWGQDLMPKSEITAGYTYGSLDQNVGFGSTGRLNSNGWNTGGTAFVNRWLGIEGNVAGLSHGEDVSVSDGINTVNGSASEKHYTFVFGPRISLGQGRISPFVHGLFGFDRESVSVSTSGFGATFSESATDTAFATALGGGLEYGLTRHVGLITGADYLLTRHGLNSDVANLLGVSGGATQNNFRVSVGMTLRFGYGSGRRPRL